ncbi:uncharacterized protein LOC110967555 [Acanthochromis polyacanthus]|uniref:uncharacterized protein LOC110967555 n=1 Tax=Acanthochromis polyacanthus TaxID=80966 RepID=UPI002233FB36|nr:uncharacterized protein LOC110967555 [Acanthochromis polyacanthus]
MQTFSTAVIQKASLPQVPQVQQQQPPPSVTTNLSLLHTSSASQQSVFLFLGLSGKDVHDAMEKLKSLYQAQCSTQTFKKEELTNLTQDNMQDLMHMVKTRGLYVKKDASGSLTVSGLTEGVNHARQIVNDAVHSNLRREMRDREEEDLFSRVTWCIQGHGGNWERLPKTANHHLENKDVAAGIVDAQGITWKVDLQRMEASSSTIGLKRKLKRLENVEDFALPLLWDSMTADEGMKVVTLEPSSTEYRRVKKAFKRTVPKAVMKVATAYGHGTYFALNASYSANPRYSKPADDGSQLMFVARVLTGLYTQGNSNMKVPPQVEGSLEDHDRYDSVVDSIDSPSMYVVFHDNQAYPEYLITFK